MVRGMAVTLLWTVLWVSPVFATTKAAYMHYLQAVLLQHRGDFSGALKEYQAAAALDPQSTYILEQATELALETGQPAQALELAQQLTQADPKNPKARLLLGNVHWARGEALRAQAAFEEALKLNPKYSEAMFALGNLLNMQSPEKAKRYFQEYLDANPERAAEAHFQIALVDERLGDRGGAIDHLTRATKIAPDFLQARYTLAHLYEVRHDTEAALGEYLALLDHESDNAALLNHIGEIYFLKGSLDSAEDIFQRSKAAEPRNPGACLWLAILAEQRGEFGRAADLLAESSALKEEAELSLRLSYYLTQANRLTEAIAVLEEARKKWRDNNELAYFLALGYDDSKQPEKAIELLKGVSQRNPDFRDARFQLAAFYEKMDRIDDMEREFRALIESRPNDASALNYLGYSLTDRGLKLQEAEGLIRRAVELDPRSGAYRDSLGWSHFKQGRYPQALEELKRALQSATEDPAVLEHLGDVQKAMGDVLSAWRSWKAGLLREPGNEKLLRKTSAFENSLPSAGLGELLLGHLGRVHAGPARLGSLCEVSGTILNRSFVFNGILSYESSGALRLELLGPLFVPVFRIEMGPKDAFAMDPFPIEGVPPETAQESVYQTFKALQDYFSGRAFEERPAQYHRGWRTRWIGTPSSQFFLDDENLRLQGVKTSGPRPVRISFDDFHGEHGRHLPRYLKIEGKGFSIDLRLTNPSVTYEKSPDPVP